MPLSETQEKTRLGFIDKEQDKESSLADHGVRKYDYETGRFMSCDALWGKYLRWSPYQYSGNNPISLFDDGGYSWSFVHEIYTRRGLRNYQEHYNVHFSEEEIQRIIDDNVQTDLYQDPSNQYQHCMLSDNPNVKYNTTDAVMLSECTLNNLGNICHFGQDRNTIVHFKDGECQTWYDWKWNMLYNPKGMQNAGSNIIHQVYEGLEWVWVTLGLGGDNGTENILKGAIGVPVSEEIPLPDNVV